MTVVGLVDQMIEHHEAILQLIRSGKVGSAFALAGSMFEAPDLNLSDHL